MVDKSDVEVQLRLLTQSYLNKLPKMLEEISTLWKLLKKDYKKQESFHKFALICHSISGAAGTFGIPGLGCLSNKVEQLLKQVEPGLQPSQQQLDQVIDELISYQFDIAFRKFSFDEYPESPDRLPPPSKTTFVT